MYKMKMEHTICVSKSLITVLYEMILRNGNGICGPRAN